MPLAHEPTFTRILGTVTELRPEAGSLYITGVSVEVRSEHTTEWESISEDVTFARLTDLDLFSVTFSTESEKYVIQLRSTTSILGFLAANRSTAIYLDITGLPHRVWAPLLRCIRSRHEPAFCVYVEPGDYQFSHAPTEVTILISVRGSRVLNLFQGTFPLLRLMTTHRSLFRYSASRVRDSHICWKLFSRSAKISSRSSVYQGIGQSTRFIPTQEIVYRFGIQGLGRMCVLPRRTARLLSIMC